LRTRLWPADTFVDFDNGLNNAANKLRTVLGDSAATPEFIETVGRRGYRFIGRLEPPDAAGPAVAPIPPPSPAVDTSTMSAAGSVRRGRLLLSGGWLLVVAAVAATAYLVSGRPAASGDPASIRSMAVLPLANLSGDPQQEYFSDGMTEAIITQLAGIRSLRVTSRQSVMQFKGSDLPMPAIGRVLHVDGVIAGTVLRTNERIRVTVQLVHAPSDTRVWSAQYERDAGDVIALQNELARAVAQAVDATLTRQEASRLDATPQLDRRAYDAYLRGRYLWNRRGAENLRRSIDYYREAVAIEPRFALAHAAIAEAYGPLGYQGFLRPDESTPNMRAAATRALEIDPDLPQGLSALGACAAFHEWRWAEGERHFQRALAVDPSYTTALMWYGLLLENMGRQEENLATRRKAVELDPVGLGANTGFGLALIVSGRFDESVGVVRKVLELDPDFNQARSTLALAYQGLGQHESAIGEFEKAGTAGSLGHAYAVAGRHAEARAVLAGLEAKSRRGYVPPHEFALVHLGLGDRAAALADLERGYALGDVSMSGIKVDRRFAPLARDPRFLGLLSKMGLLEGR
jgi:TolB-like protein/Flp pilus assembly protein TadD